MGTLVAKKYPAFFSKSPVDHTYVECGTGRRGWSCWGGKTGGTAFKTGTASTVQADKVAQPDEKAGITCYAINGVCHQAANRILIHAGVLVSGARGYQVSQSLYGPYGRTLNLPFGICQGSFNQFPGVSGDLPECVTPPGFAARIAEPVMSPAEREREQAYVRRLAEVHIDGERTFRQARSDRAGFVNYQLNLFREQVIYRLGSTWEAIWGKLASIRETAEQRRMPLEDSYANREMEIREYAGRFDELTIQFQNDCATALKEQDYMSLFELKPGDAVTLIDPEMLGGSRNDPEPTPTPTR